MEIIATTTIICGTIIVLLILTLKCITQTVDKYIASKQPPQVEIDKAIQVQIDNLNSKLTGLHMASGLRKR